MRSILVSLILFSPLLLSEQAPLPAQGPPTQVQQGPGFDAAYLKLQNKITTLKNKGEKVSEDARKEMDAMMVQMNHEHTELKRQLEKKNNDLTQKVNSGIKAGQDWTSRAADAGHEVADGFKRAWLKITKGSEKSPD